MLETWTAGSAEDSDSARVEELLLVDTALDFLGMGRCLVEPFTVMKKGDDRPWLGHVGDISFPVHECFRDRFITARDLGEVSWFRSPHHLGRGIENKFFGVTCAEELALKLDLLGLASRSEETGKTSS